MNLFAVPLGDNHDTAHAVKKKRLNMYSRMIPRQVWFCAILWVAMPLMALEAGNKSPVPDSSAQAEAMKLVKEVYGDEYDKAKTPVQKQALAKKLLQKVEETQNDPTNKYVLLKLAKGVAVEAADVETAFAAVDAMAQSFEANPIELKAGVLIASSKKAQLSLEHASVAKQALALMDQAVAKDSFDLAAQLGELALAEAQIARGPQLVQQIKARVAETEELTRAYEEMKKAASVLRKKPIDPEANLAVGKYLCFIKGDWDYGISKLALGSDAKLKAVATKDLQGAASAEEQVKVGDGWWELVPTSEESMLKQLQARSGYWYRQALPELVPGLVKDKVEKRLASLGNVAMPTRDNVPDADKAEMKEHVSAALRWLAHHQMADGGWSLQNFSQRCRDKTCTGSGGVSADAGATALGLLPFLAAGQTHKTTGPYRTNINAGLSWLTRHQQPDGNLAKGAGQNMYSHGLATIALCNAYGLSKDKRLKTPAQNAINFIVNAQNKKDGGWRYKPGDPGDTCVTVWQLAALKSAHMAGLNVGGSVFSSTSKFLDSVAVHDGIEYAYTPGSGSSPTMTAAGLYCRQYLGVKRENPMLTGGMSYLMKNLPEEGLPNIYYWYYATQVMHNMSGHEWDTWNRKMRDLLVRTQIRNVSECANGSWDPTKDAWGKSGGRVMQTSLSALTLTIGSSELPMYK